MRAQKAFIPLMCTPPPKTTSQTLQRTTQPPPRISRRKLLPLFLLPFLPTQTEAASATNRTVVNSILSAYGLPTLPDTPGYTPLLEQYDKLVVQFIYPSAWVVNHVSAPREDDMGLAQANGYMKLGGVNKPIEGRASGLTVGDYRRAEGVSFFACDVKGKGVKDVEGQFIAELVTPGDARGTLPEVRVVKDSVDAEGYRVVDTRYESTTVSGYTVFRRGRTRATVLSDGKLYALTASCSENRWKKAGEMLGKSLDSFSVFRV